MVKNLRSDCINLLFIKNVTTLLSERFYQYLGQDIKEWTKKYLWKTTFKNLK